jgi:hypothetical protein
MLAGLGLAAAGCGGSKAPSVASLSASTTTGPSSTSSSTTPAKPSRAGFAACLTAHGFQASAGSGGNLTVFGVSISGNVDPSSPQFQAALAACRKFLPGGGPPTLTPAQEAAASKAMLSFAACMRRHGVPNFPDPSGSGLFPFAGLKGLDPTSPAFQAAFKSCESLEPKVGPRIEFGGGGGS